MILIIKCGKIKCGKSLVTYSQYDEIDKLIKSGYKLDSLNPIVKRVQDGDFVE